MKRVIRASAAERRVFSQEATRNASPFVACPSLSAAIPRLKEVFASKADADNVFPLFTPKANKYIWKNVKLNEQRQAAVLVPLVSYNGVPSLLFTKRSSDLPTHASEVSFPGGHFEPKDQTLEDTAIREAQEELLGDYPWDKVEILGTATPLPSINGTPVTPVIGVLPFEISSNTFPGDPGEVDEIFCVTLQNLMDIESSEDSTRFPTKIPLFPAGENKRIWGLTAIITRPLLHKLFKPVFLSAAAPSSRL